MTLDYFLKRANEVHSLESYDYSLIKTKDLHGSDKIQVICHKHGVFEISVNNFLNGRKCKHCNKEIREAHRISESQKDFIKKAKLVHGNKYDYSKVKYQKAKLKVCIICPEHGEFWQTPDAHLRGEGCKLCSCSVFDGDSFIKKSREIHGDKYDYSKVEYVDSTTKVCIVCPEHGEFWQRPRDHTQGKGCRKCGNETCCERSRKTLDTFKKEMLLKFGDIYDFSKVEWVNCHTKIILINKDNGKKITETPTRFLSNDKPITYKRVRSFEDFVEKSNKIHYGRYNYSKVEWVDCQTPIKIICPEHGEFMQKPCNHLNGCGCRKCQISQLELKAKNYLDEHNIKYVYQYYPDFLSEGLSHQSLDFYLPDFNTAIECQGEQHYREVTCFGGAKGLNNNIERDIKKYNKTKGKIKLVYLINGHIKIKDILNSKKYDNIYLKNNSFVDMGELIKTVKRHYVTSTKSGV